MMYLDLHIQGGPRRRAILARLVRGQHGHCFYCGRKMALKHPRDVSFAPGHATIDHRIPLAKGGTDEIGNLVAACRRCNEAKGDAVGWRPGRGRAS